MDRRERIGDRTLTFITAFEGMQSSMWTAMPGFVRAYDATKGTVSVELGITFLRTLQDGSQVQVAAPLLPDVPVVFPSGGGFTLTFPLADGDPVLVVLASRCIDAWWDTNSVSQQTDSRMHDLSDGFAIPGPRPRPAVPGAVSTTDVELRSDAGDSHVRITAGGDVNVLASGAVTAVAGTNATVTAPGTITLTAPVVTINGNLTVEGTVTSTGLITAPDAALGGKSFSTHTHGNVQNGSGHTGAPS